MQEAQEIKEIIMSFCNDSGQTLNWNKSSIFFSSSTSSDIQANIRNFFQVSNINNSTTHLGHPLLNLHGSKYNLYAFLKDKFKNKFSNWKADCILTLLIPFLSHLFSLLSPYTTCHIFFCLSLYSMILLVL